MNKAMSKRRFSSKAFSVVISLIIIAVVTVVIMGEPTQVKAYASTEETADTVKVFVGDIKCAPDGYVDKRFNYISELAQSDPTRKIETVVGLNEYYSIDSVDELMDVYDVSVSRVYMWPEGETGRLSLYIENGKIAEGIESFIKQVEEKGLDNDAQSINDFARFLNGEYKIFAFTITSSAEVLSKMVSEHDCFSYADIKYNVDAEKYAEEKGKDTYYIELPSKPDNAA